MLQTALCCYPGCLRALIFFKRTGCKYGWEPHKSLCMSTQVLSMSTQSLALLSKTETDILVTMGRVLLHVVVHCSEPKSATPNSGSLCCREEVLKEIEIVSKTNHPNILSLKEFFLSKTKVNCPNIVVVQEPGCCDSVFTGVESWWPTRVCSLMDFSGRQLNGCHCITLRHVSSVPQIWIIGLCLCEMK